MIWYCIKKLEEHEENVHKVLQRLCKHKLYAKKTKCAFFITQIKDIGFIVSHDGISIDLASIKDIVDINKSLGCDATPSQI